MKYDDIVGNLLRNIEEFNNSPEFEELDYNNNLAYLVLGAFSRFYERKFLELDTELVKKMSIFLEGMAGSDYQKVRELLDFGFLENFDQHMGYFQNVVKTFGPKTNEELKYVNEHWHKLEEKNKKDRK